MSLPILLIYISIIAIVLTLVIGYGFKKHKSWLMTFLQNFTGVLFIISGFVKAVDPLGTAYKMEQYFGEFEASFADSMMSFIAPIFPFFSTYSIAFSLFMIILEIVLGVLLIIGAKAKLTSWAFLLLIILFTILTGFTFLTGFVPQTENFFDFGAWAEYNPSNMRVTDCGCFGDFIVLEPRISFFKDLVLLIPAFYFVFKHKDMHQLFSKKTNNIIAVAVTIGLLIYCMNNYVWNIPHADFRPFKKDVNIRDQKLLEEEAMANVKVLNWHFKNKETGEMLNLSNDEYMANYKMYPLDKFELLERKMSEPTVKQTKVSEFEVTGEEGYDIAEEILNNPEPVFMIISHKVPAGNPIEVEKEVMQEVSRTDTIRVGNDTIVVESKDTISTTVISKTYDFKPKYMNAFTENLTPFLNEAMADGVESMLIAGGSTAEMLEDFKQKSEFPGQIYTADDILLKTIVRSNPGIVLIKDGLIINKWHIKKLPTYTEVAEQYLR